MPDITISVAGIDKLLKNLQPNKAAGPDDLPTYRTEGAPSRNIPYITGNYR